MRRFGGTRFLSTMQHRALSIRNLLRLPALGLALLCLGGADDCDQTEPTPQAPELEITSITVDHAHAQPGDLVTLQWELKDAQLLDSTRVAWISTTLQGLATPYETYTDRSMRSLSFTFRGPVTVELFVQDRDGGGDSVSFDVRYDEQYHLTAELENTDVRYPDVGGRPGEQIRSIDFANIAAFEDPSGARDGLITVLADPLYQMPTSLDFLAASTRVEENTRFGMTQGSRYPLVTTTFTSTGAPFRYGQSTDLIVFGGAVAYSGEVFDVKSPEGYIEGARLVTHYEPIFLELVYIRDASGNLWLADALLGNLDQGLVVSIAHGDTADTSLFTGCTLGCGPGQSGAARIANGMVAGSVEAVLAWSVHTTSGELVWPHVALRKLSFEMPLFRDDDPALIGG